MNRKIMLLPLSAAVLLGLASCGPKEDSSESSNPPAPVSSSVEPPVSSSVEEPYDGGILDLVDMGIGETAKAAEVTGIVGQMGEKGWTIDDAKGATYVYGALDSKNFKVGDHVAFTGEAVGYYGLYELQKGSVNKLDVAGPTLAAPVEATAAELQAAFDVLSVAGSKAATWSPANCKRLKLTGYTLGVNAKGTSTVTVEGFDHKLVPHYYVSDYNVTEANRNVKLYPNCKYDIEFYIGGTDADKNVNMHIFDVTAHYDAVTDVNVTGDTDVKVGAEVTLNGSVLPATADQGLTWTSSDPAIATVNNGKVKGVAAGNVTITATSTADNTKKKEYAMTVSEVTSFKEIPAEGITLNVAAFGDKIGNGTYKDAADVTIGGLSWKASVNKNLLAQNNYGTSDDKHSVLQIKKQTGTFLAINDAVESVESITINMLSTYATQEAKYLPTIVVGGNAVSCNEIAGQQNIAGTLTGWQNYDSNNKVNRDVYSYAMTYNVSTIVKTQFAFNGTESTLYIDSIVIK